MNMAERNMIKDLQRLHAQIPDEIPVYDERDIRHITYVILNVLLEAEEPANDTETYHAHARHLLAYLHEFVKIRTSEKWQASSCFEDRMTLYEYLPKMQNGKEEIV